MRFTKNLSLSILLALSSSAFAEKLTDQPALTTPANNDIIHVVDVSDVTSGAAGTSKQVLLSDAGLLYKATSTVMVNVLSDLPAASGGVITLVANTNYVLGANVSIGTDRIDASAGGISWTSNNQFGPTLTYTGTGSMFTVLDNGFHMFQARLIAASGQVFDFSDVAAPGTHLIQVERVQVSGCSKFATMTNLQAIIINNSEIVLCNDGLTTVGSSWSLISVVRFGMITTDPTFIGIDLGTSVTLAAEMQNLAAIGLGAPGAIAVSGLTNSGNILAGSLATFRDANILGNMTPIAGLTPDDTRWKFDGNAGIQDTMPDGLASLNANASETVISFVSTPVKVVGTWVVERQSQFTVDTTGRITYIGERPITVPIDIVTTINSAGGTNKDIEIYAALNGSIIPNSGKTNRVGQNDPKSTTVMWQLTLNQNDFLEVFVENDTDTVNLVVSDAILRVR